MYNIQLNESGTRHMHITQTNLQTIQAYHLFENLPGASGYITDDDLEKLRLTIRSLIISTEQSKKDLLDLCIDVIYHDKMKAFGLRNLVQVYHTWANQASTSAAASSDNND